LLGIIPESQDVLKASNVGSPVTLNNADSAPARAYVDASRRLLGEEIAMVVPTERKGFMEPLAGTEGGMNMKLLAAVRRPAILPPRSRERLGRSCWRTNAGWLGQPDLLATLREEILAVVSRHVTLDPGEGDRPAGAAARPSRRWKSISRSPTISRSRRRLPTA